MNHYNCIYKLTSPSGKSYIGQTINFNKRMLCYRGVKCCDQLLIYRAIKKYGWKSFTVDILTENAKVEYLDMYEMAFIRFYDTFGENGYNLTSGGGGTRGIHLTEARKIQISNISKLMWANKTREELLQWSTMCSKNNKGKILSDETRKLISIGHIGKKHSDETKTKLSELNKGYRNRFYGKHHSIETKEKLKSYTGRIPTDEARKNMRLANAGDKNGFYNKSHTVEIRKYLSSIRRKPNTTLTGIDETGQVRVVSPIYFKDKKKSEWHRLCSNLYMKEYKRRKYDLVVQFSDDEIKPERTIVESTIQT